MPWEDALPSALTGGAALESAAMASYDSDAFAGFYERSARPLWAYLARVSGNPALADDLVQESYVRFLCAERQPALAAEGEVAAQHYLFRIGSNLLHDHWRRPCTASLDDSPEELFATETEAGSADARMLLGPALRQLRPRDRQILWLAYAEGYTHREIAEVTGLASASIRLLLFRARHRMARLLGEGARRSEQ
jgi:RNA polymerase sigma-70 factor (ECF subfamily)